MPRSPKDDGSDRGSCKIKEELLRDLGTQNVGPPHKT